MFRNYLVTALRSIARHKLYSFINIAGLAVGLACAVLIILFVRDELSFDKWIPGSEKLYRIETSFHVPGREVINTSQTPFPLPPAMREYIPEVRAVTRLTSTRMTMISGDRLFLEQVAFADANFFQFLPLPLVSGDPRTMLVQPQSVVLSEKMAKKYFGNADPVGKTISTARTPCAPDAVVCDNSTVPLTVTGVMRDLPHNTQLEADMVIPNTSIVDRLPQDAKQNWLSTNSTYGYALLSPGADPATVLAKLKPILDRSIDLSPITNIKMAGSALEEVRLTPFQQVHLTTDRFSGQKPAGSWTTIYGLGAIAVVILLVACFNFTNLATARATLRAREISLRKCMGATRRQLIVQFLGESVLMALVALVFALALVEILLPAYGQFMQRALTFGYLADWPLLAAILATAVTAGLISGIYPALVLSGFRPAATLRTNASGQGGSGLLRTTLVVLQFSVSIALGIAALIVFLQIDFARKLDLGFRRDNIVITGSGGRLSPAARDSFAKALANGPGVIGVARSNFVPFSGFNDIWPTQKPGDPQMYSPTRIAITPEFLTLYGIKMLAGRSLSDKRGEDLFSYAKLEENEGRNVLLNAAAARYLGYKPQEVLGKSFLFGKNHMRVVGVTSDILIDGGRSPVVPSVYVYAPENTLAFSIRMQGDRIPEAMAHIERVSRAFVPTAALSKTFLNDSFERLYQSDQKQGAIFSVFVAIAIVIACLGLFGLAAFTAGRRTKEIGIRKVFGARNRDVIFLLLWQFSIPVLLANVIAWPVAWYYLHGWLQGFAYRIPLSPLYFVGAGLTALAIAWATIFAHASRVARSNPIKALRYE